MTNIHNDTSDHATNLLESKWLIYGKSVRGPSHSYSGKPNQDSIYWLHSSNSNSILLAVADGHGNDIHFRSRIGSKIAVKSAVKTLDTFLNNQSIEFYNISQYKDAFRYSIPRLLVHNWANEVHDHLDKHPFSSKEIELLSKNNNPSILKKIVNDPKIAYGSTLLTSIVTENYIVFLQIGDGNILVVNDQGNTFSPFKNKNSDLLNEGSVESIVNTESLCMVNSWLEFKTGMFAFYDIKPKLILLSTDGYSNSFTNEENFFKIGVDYLHLMSDFGYAYLVKNLQRILKQTSSKGSGDDITLGLIYKYD